MAQKKDRSRFSIKFSEGDPANDMTIRILENQGQRKIAPFLVNAVLHYVQCSETPDIAHMLAENSKSVADKNAIEVIVKEILRQQGIIKEEIESEIKEEKKLEEKYLEDKENKMIKDVMSQHQVDDNMRAIIARTLSVFKNE